MLWGGREDLGRLRGLEGRNWSLLVRFQGELTFIDANHCKGGRQNAHKSSHYSLVSIWDEAVFGIRREQPRSKGEAQEDQTERNQAAGTYHLVSTSGFVPEKWT